ncbi:MAG: FprA family A-type flavoprotein [Candidatus Omnitrophota bacterium]|jgi:flavorubredoxin
MIKIAENIYWAGYIDWNLRSFHGYSTPSGSTYNSYLIIDDQPTLIDTVKHYGFDEMLERIKEIIEPSKIKYIISNHTEMDHSGSIGKLLEHCSSAEVVCSPKGEEGLKKHFAQSSKKWKFKVVNSGDSLKIGEHNLKFFLMPMVHWPDSMATYSENDSILFSNDAFGQHYASNERFVDEVGRDIIIKEATKYYANIVMPYGGQVLKAFEAIKDIKIDMICPSHGLMWREKDSIEKIITLYKKWANYATEKSVVIVYDTMWHSTEAMAIKLYELLNKENISIKLFNLQNTHISDIMAEVISAKVLAVGSPVLNNKVLPTMGAFLTYLKGLKPKNRFGFTFGSYGWARVAFKELEDSLKEAGMELIAEGSYINYVPIAGDLDNLKGIVSKIKSLL